MKRIKRVLMVFLVISLCFSILPAEGFAWEEEQSAAVNGEPGAEGKPVPEVTVAPVGNTEQPEPTVAPDASASPTPDASASPTADASASPTPDASASPTPDASASPTADASASPTIVPWLDAPQEGLIPTDFSPVGAPLVKSVAGVNLNAFAAPAAGSVSLGGNAGDYLKIIYDGGDTSVQYKNNATVEVFKND